MIVEIPEWMLPLSEQGRKIHHEIISKTGEPKWELGEIASRQLVYSLQSRVKELEEALRKITQIHWGYDGDCGAVRIAEDVLQEPPVNPTKEKQ